MAVTRAALNVKADAEHHISSVELYLPKLSDKIRRVKLAGHCFRRKKRTCLPVITVEWTPYHGRRGRGTPAKTYTEMCLKRILDWRWKN